MAAPPSPAVSARVAWGWGNRVAENLDSSASQILRIDLPAGATGRREHEGTWSALVAVNYPPSPPPLESELFGHL